MAPREISGQFELFIEKLAKVDPSIYYLRYSITEKDKMYIEELLLVGDYTEAMNYFVDKYMKPYSKEYQDSISATMHLSLSHELDPINYKTVEHNIVVETATYSTIIGRGAKYIIRKFMKSGKSAKDLPTELQKKITDNAISQFDKFTKGTLLRTREDILGDIRNIQRDIITEKSKWKGLEQDEIDREVYKFKQRIKNQYKSYYDKMDGKIIQSSDYPSRRKDAKSGEMSHNTYTLEHYADMSIRTTMLNTDRIREETTARYKEEEVVEYYKKDSRKLKTGVRRNICVAILGHKIAGKSLLAITPEAANKYQIMTIEEAKSTYDYAMGIYCTHSVKRVGEAYLKSIRKLKSAKLQEASAKDPYLGEWTTGKSEIVLLDEDMKKIYFDKMRELTKKYEINPIQVRTFDAKGGSIAASNLQILLINKSEFNKKSFDKTYKVYNKNYKTLIEEHEKMIKQFQPRNNREKLNKQNALQNMQEAKKYERWFALDRREDIEKHIVSHEYGHILSDQYLGMINRSPRMKKKVGKKWQRDMLNRWTSIDSDMYKNKDIRKISYYASTNSSESFAECFAMYDNPRERGKLPIYIRRYFDDFTEGTIPKAS